jgi:hypothetical protein
MKYKTLTRQKVKLFLSMPSRHKGKEMVAPLIFNPGCREKQVVNFMSQLHYPPKAGWAPEPMWTDCANFATPAPDDTDFKLMVIAHAEECNNCTTASKSFVMKQDV